MHAGVTRSGRISAAWGVCTVSTYDNAGSGEGKTKYKSEFALLPTLGHTLDEKGQRKFVICSWRVNDAKGDLTEAEFYHLCVRVVQFWQARVSRS
jgi:hypothetical protein